MNKMTDPTQNPQDLFICDLSGSLIQKLTDCDAVIDPAAFISSDDSTDTLKKIHHWIEKHPSVHALEIRIPKFTDGRGFSLAARFREAGFKGELHASGDITQDLIFLLRRVGFTHFHLSLKANEKINSAVLTPFAAHYQAGQDGSAAGGSH